MTGFGYEEERAYAMQLSPRTEGLSWLEVLQSALSSSSLCAVREYGKLTPR